MSLHDGLDACSRRADKVGMDRHSGGAGRLTCTVQGDVVYSSVCVGMGGVCVTQVLMSTCERREGKVIQGISICNFQIYEISINLGAQYVMYVRVPHGTLVGQKI